MILNHCDAGQGCTEECTCECRGCQSQRALSTATDDLNRAEEQLDISRAAVDTQLDLMFKRNFTDHIKSLDVTLGQLKNVTILILQQEELVLRWGEKRYLWVNAEMNCRAK